MPCTPKHNRWSGAALGLALGCLLLGVALRTSAQNLVPNPSFESIDECPGIGGYGPGAHPTQWFRYNSTPDYFNRCEPDGSAIGVPMNFGGWQEPVEGDAYSGMLTSLNGTSQWQEMIASELTLPLNVGETYYVSFRVNAAAGGSEWPMIASSHFGALFTTQAPEWDHDQESRPLRNFAHVYTSDVVADTADWTLISGSFVADSTYRYIVLGNHFDSAHTSIDTIVIMPDTSAYLYRAYTYVDQVCVSTNPLFCPLVQGIDGVRDMPRPVFPNPASDVLWIPTSRPGEQMRIMDASGRLIWQSTAQGTSMQVQVGGWNEGCYVLHRSLEGTRSSSLFVVMRH